MRSMKRLLTARKKLANDKRFAENYLYARSQRGYGANRIKQELRQLKRCIFRRNQ